MAYPTESEKGVFIGIFWAIFNLGAVVGASVAFGQNFHSTVTLQHSVPDFNWLTFQANAGKSCPPTLYVSTNHMPNKLVMGPMYVHLLFLQLVPIWSYRSHSWSLPSPVSSFLCLWQIQSTWYVQMELELPLFGTRLGKRKSGVSGSPFALIRWLYCCSQCSWHPTGFTLGVSLAPLVRL